jgi:hypothetical protein
MGARDDYRAGREAAHEARSKHPTEHETRSEVMLRTYLGAAMYSVLRQRREKRRTQDERAEDQPSA